MKTLSPQVLKMWLFFIIIIQLALVATLLALAVAQYGGHRSAGPGYGSIHGGYSAPAPAYGGGHHDDYVRKF